MYKISILNECNDELVRVAIIAAVNEILYSDSNFFVTRMRHGKINAPVWNTFSRQENLNNKF